MDDLLDEVVYREVYPAYCLPLLNEKLRQWHIPIGDASPTQWPAFRRGAVQWTQASVHMLVDGNDTQQGGVHDLCSTVRGGHGTCTS